MAIRDLQRHFRSAPWANAAEIRAFVVEVGALSPSDLSALLPVLTERASATQPQHRVRCQAFAALVDASPSEELFIPMTRSLRGADAMLRQTLVALLVKVGRSADPTELCQFLALNDADVRKAASEVLKQIGGRVALQVLTQLCATPSFPGRLEALAAMVPRAGGHALPLIASTVKLGKPPERAQALRYLADEPRLAKEGAPALRIAVSALDDKEERVAAQAIVAFGALATEEQFFRELGARIDDVNPTIVRAVIEGLGRHRTARSIAALGRKLRQGPNPIRLSVLDALRAMGGEEVLPVIVEALGHRQQIVRNKAAEALWELAQRGQVDLARMVLWLLRSQDVNVRRMAVELARRVGDPTGELAPRLLRHLRDEDWWVRERVVDAVIEMIGHELSRHLVAFLNDPSDVVRRWAIGALTRVKDPRALGALVRAAKEDKDWWVREQAIEACAAIQDPRAIPYVVHFMQSEPELRLVCLAALETLAAKTAAPQVAELVADPDAEVRLASVRCLEALDAKDYAARIQQCVNDPEPRVHRAATALLTRWNQLRRGAAGTMSTSATALDKLLVATADAGADDLILVAGRSAYLKTEGAMKPLDERVFTPAEVVEILRAHLTREQQDELDHLRDVDFSYEVKSHGLRFRANVFQQVTGLGAVFRIVKGQVPSLEDLGLPAIVQTFSSYRQGLVLVGGPTGSGKSTTLAAIIHDINSRLGHHIITFEDPIEVVHRRKEALINQREVGTHVHDLSRGLRATLREDPDVILMGEMRDLATLSFAITAAETGHLVFGTVHTVSADTSIDRMINAFPSGQQEQVRTILADALRAVVCQHLLRRADGPGRVAAAEILLNTDAVANLIRKGKTFQIPSVIATSRESGMQSMDDELMRLLSTGKIHADEAYMKARDKKLFEAYLPADLRPAREEDAAGATAAQPVSSRAADVRGGAR
jgi:twitching motility protein PilT